MAIIRINLPVPGDGQPYVAVTWPQDSIPAKAYSSGDLVRDWFHAVTYCINAIIRKDAGNTWISFDTAHFDHSEAFHDYLVAWLVPVPKGYALMYGRQPEGKAIRMYVPRDKPMTFEELHAYVKSISQPIQTPA